MRVLSCTPGISARSILAAYCPTAQPVVAACGRACYSHNTNLKRQGFKQTSTTGTCLYRSLLHRNLHSNSSSSSRGVTSSCGSSRSARFFRSASAASSATMVTVTQISANKHHGGYNRRYRHSSNTLGCDMTFTVSLCCINQPNKCVTATQQLGNSSRAY